MTARLNFGADDTARLDPDTGAVTQSLPARRPSQQNDASPHDAVRARWREVVRRARPVDKTARLDLGGDRTARLDLGGDRTARLDLVSPQRRRQQNVALLHQAPRGRGGDEVVRHAEPIDDSRSFRLNPSIPVLGILLILTATVRLINLTGSPARLDDEGTYMAQAYAVAEWRELAHYTYWYDHPPGGWLQLALWTAISGPDFGGNAVAAGRYLMVIVAVITAALLWALARRIEMSRWATAAAVAVFALSPLAISLGRTVYLDNLAAAWLLGALVLVCSPRYRLSAMFGAATCFGIAVLTKETMLLLLPMFAWLVWTRTAPVTRRYALAVFVAVFGVVVSTYVLMAVLRGELVPGPGHVSLWDGIRFQLWERTAGGALDDPYSLKRHTVDEWFQLDPALPFLAVPIALAALFVKRLRPFAVGLVILIATILRPGYLPVPFILFALPLTALLAAGTGEVALRYLFRSVEQRSVVLRRFRVPALAAGALIVSIAVSLWLPTYHGLLESDDDASMRQAQQWIEQNVPKTDRLIVDDALWLDLIRDGRDRRNVVWAYKVDTDEQVQGWAPHGWTDYDWVVSTASLRANMPPNGVLTDAVAHSQPAAIFDSGGTRVEVLRVDNGEPTSKPPLPAAPAFGGQLAARLAGATDPNVLAALQSRTVDQPVLATLAVIAATQPVRVEDISTIEGEDDTGTPRRDITLTGPRHRLLAIAAFLERQVGPFAVQSVDLTAKGLRVRFPLRTKDIGLGTGPVRCRAIRPRCGWRTCVAADRPSNSTWCASTAPRPARLRRATTRIRRAIGRCPRGRTWW